MRFSGAGMRRDPLSLLQPSDLARIARTLDLTEISDSSDLQAAASFLLMAPKSSKWLKTRTEHADAVLASVSQVVSKLTNHTTLVRKRLLDEVASRVSVNDPDRFDAMLAALIDCEKVLTGIVGEYHATASRPLEVEETAEKILPLVTAYRRIVEQQLGSVEWRDELPGKNSQEGPALRYRQYAFARAVIGSVITAAKSFPELELAAGFETAHALQSKGVSALRNALERATEMLDGDEPQS